MSTYSHCPSCGYKGVSGPLTGAYFNVYKCSDCGKKYCYNCPGSNGGRKCPGCGSEKKNAVGEVYLK